MSCGVSKHQAESATMVLGVSQEQKHYLNCVDTAMGVVKGKLVSLAKKGYGMLGVFFNII